MGLAVVDASRGRRNLRIGQACMNEVEGLQRVRSYIKRSEARRRTSVNVCGGQTILES